MIHFNDQLEANREQFSMKFQPAAKKRRKREQAENSEQKAAILTVSRHGQVWQSNSVAGYPVD